MLQKLFQELLSSEQEKRLQYGEEQLIGTRFFGEEDFDDVPAWVQQQIRKIGGKRLGDAPEDLTHELNGRTFIYRLDFDGPDGEILGVYRRLRYKPAPSKKQAPAKKPAKAKKRMPPAQWEPVPDRRVPAWVRRTIDNIHKHDTLSYRRTIGPYGSISREVYPKQTCEINGRRYRYRLEFLYNSVDVFRKPRR